MIENLITAAVIIAAVVIGYLMGRKTVILDGQPIAPPTTNQGSTDEPEGDYIADELPDYTNMSERRPTIDTNL